MQKMRPRRTGKQTASKEGATGDAATDSAGRGAPAHVRNRLIVAVAVVAAAIAGAGAPTVLAASGRLSDSQDLVTFARQTQEALTLAHSLADERDEVVPYIAAGRPKTRAPSEQRSARVDRQVEELRADADAPAGLRKNLDAVAAVRRAALTGKSTALQAHQAYSEAITELHGLAEELAQLVPPRAGSGAYALAELDTAVQQAASTRGLLLAALAVPRSTRTSIDPVTGLPTTSESSSDTDAKQRDALSAAAQQARLRSDAALSDFRDTAPKAARASYDSTVNGPDVTSADKYLATLTDQPTLSDDELGTSVKKLDAALSARVELMRGVEASLNDRRTKELARLRDDDVTGLELRVALLGALLLVAVGVSTAMARTLTRPLAVLRIGSARVAADPATEEPVKFTGRNDEFAQVVRSVNTLRAHAAALHERQATLEADRKHLIGQRQTMADERARLRTELAAATAHLEQVRHSIHGTFVNLALRTLGLVERQLAVIEKLEEREQDPERLSTLFKLDHFATVMRRHSENLLVLAGAEHIQQHAGPVPLVDVVRASVSEIERYERVRIAALPPHAHLAGFAADDLSHLVAELLENATSSSPPDMAVEVSGWLLESGEVMLSVQDEGIGMTTERMEQLNARLADFDPDDAYDEESGEGLGLGLYVVARLAHRHGVRVNLREQKQGGVAAVVVLPKALLAAAPAAAAPAGTASAPALGGAPALSLPGVDAEANSNVLHGRSTTAPTAPTATPDPAEASGAPTAGDPLIAAAEQAVRAHAAPDGPAREPGTDEAARESGMDEAVREPGTDEAVRESGSDGAVREPGADHAVRAPRSDHAAVPAPGAGEDVREPGAADGTAPEFRTRDASGDPRADAAPHASRVGDAPRDGENVSRAERPSETTMELLAPESPADEPPASAPAAEPETTAEAGSEPPTDAGLPARTTTGPYAIGPDTHDRVADEPQRVTAKGLPKRTPKISAPAPAPRQRTGGVDAEALRRRLGGFHRGALEGRRDVEAEIAEETSQTRAPEADAVPAAHDVPATGGTVEEASS
ncbi:nitrate- and nitrite sensing domain-containing protein [Streptomyces sp. NPDC005907]|uniref:sensor histidine kinase n=1 Tax=Streptomyces sp. NPDC005907 TaxID=3154571 RepID=UPI0033E987AB